MKTINALLIIGIIGFFVFGSHFAVQYGRAVWGDPDMWWTPGSMALPLEETRQEFEMYVRDEILQNHIERRSLIAIDSKGRSHPLTPDDIELRLNNWNKVKGSFLHSAVFSALMLGASITCLVLGAVQFVGKSKENRRGKR